MRNRTGVLLLTVLSAIMLIALFHSVPRVPVIRAAQTAAAPGDVVINEVGWMGTEASSSDEWIEFYNNSDLPIDIANWSIHGADTGACLNLSAADGSLTTTIAAHGYLLYGNDDDVANDAGGTSLVSIWDATIGLNNTSPGQIILYDAPDCAGTPMDTANQTTGNWLAGEDANHLSMERVDPLASGTAEANWCTNDGAIRNGEDAGGNPINGTPRAENSCYISSEPAPRLRLVKSGPAAVAPGALITYQITVSNTGTLTATHVVITDALPAGLDAVAQTSPYPFTDSGPLLHWDVGTLPTSTLGQITLTVSQTAALTGTVTNVITGTIDGNQQATAAWETAIVPNVRLYALQPGNYGGVSGEAAALINLGADPVNLSDWCLDDQQSPGTTDTFVCFSAGATINSGQVLWLAEDGAGFAKAWGFDADWAVAQPQTSSLDGPWPGFTDDGEDVYLLNDQGHVVDALAYGQGSATTGWTGAAVPHPYSGYNNAAQVLYRKLDETSGRPVPDTDTAADWAQDPDDPYGGRKIRYPGWDLEALFTPAEITTSAPITVAIAPDASLGVVSQTLAAAQESILIEGYTFESVALYNVISERLQSGVAVTVLLESNIVGGMADVEKWIVDKIDASPNGQVAFMDDEQEDLRRYRYQHAKFIVVDNKTALISTDNFNDRSMPVDRLDNGTGGHRGVVVVTEAPGVVARLQTLFARDCDPTHHVDVIPYTDYGDSLAPPDSYVPLPQPDWTTYTAVFSQPLVTTASHLTVMHGPEHSLRATDALLGLLNQADSGDAIASLQLNEPLTWTHNVGVIGRNPRVQALVDAARRGATVRLLLDAYYDDPLDDNGNTATCLFLNDVADAEELDLVCRLANVTGLGIHAKACLVDVGDEQWSHVGSINGSETSNKVNREVALQFESKPAYDTLHQVFEHDWARGHGPMIHRVHLPLVFRDYVAPADYPLLTEIYINPKNQPETPETDKEWIEIYHPGDKTVDLAGWTIGDALTDGEYGDGRYAFPGNTTLVPKQILVIAACAKEFSANYGFNPDYEWTECDATVPNLTPTGDWDGFGVALGNTQDEMLLHNAAGQRVDSVAWGGSVRAGIIPFTDFEGYVPTDSSLERTPAHTDRDDCNRDFWISYSPDPREVWTP